MLILFGIKEKLFPKRASTPVVFFGDALEPSGEFDGIDQGNDVSVEPESQRQSTRVSSIHSDDDSDEF